MVESINEGRAMAAKSGETFIHPYDDEKKIPGQSAQGLEILEDLPDADIIIVPARWA